MENVDPKWVGIGIAVICAIISGNLLQKKGYPFSRGFLLGILLGPIGLLIAIFAKPDKAGVERMRIEDGEKKCPRCAELIKREALVCKHCGADQSFTATATN